MDKEEILNMSFKVAWEKFKQKNDGRELTMEEKLIWYEGFNFACYLLSKDRR